MTGTQKPFWVERGDTFFTHSDSVLGRLIRWGETDPGETPAWTNHVGVVVQRGWVGDDCPAPKTCAAGGKCGTQPQAVVVEALWTTRRGPLKLNGVQVRVFRPVPAYTEEELQRFVAEAGTYVGDRYGWWKLLFQLGDRAIFRGKKVLTHMLSVDNRPICSYLGAKVNNAARRIGQMLKPLHGVVLYWPGFGMDPETADPDSMLRFCEQYPELWMEVK